MFPFKKRFNFKKCVLWCTEQEEDAVKYSGPAPVVFHSGLIQVNQRPYFKTFWGFQESIPSLTGPYDNPISRTGPTSFIGWRNRFIGIDSWTPKTFTNMGSFLKEHFTQYIQYIAPFSWYLQMHFAVKGTDSQELEQKVSFFIFCGLRGVWSCIKYGCLNGCHYGLRWS